MLKQKQRITSSPALQLLTIAVGCWVTDIVAAETVGLAFDEARPITRACALDSYPCRLIDRFGIIPINHNRWDSICSGSVSNILNRRKAPCTGGAGVLVMFAEEDHWEAVNSSPVETLVERPTVCRSITEEGEGNLSSTAEFDGHCSTGCEAETTSHNPICAEHPHAKVGDVHAPPTATADSGRLAKKLSHHARWIGTLGQGVPMTTVSARDVVVNPERCAGAGGRSLLTNTEVHEARQFTGKKEALYRLLEAPNTQHGVPERDTRHGSKGG
jgi:hypothetical protein